MVEASDAEEPENQQPLLKCFGKKKKPVEQEKLDRKKKKARPMQIENSIYNMALYTLIDKSVTDQW